uniref:Uncharacterized protein n=1 Tax=Romanomermis culicivorax TaxID=13658 RepID=A0A915IXQ4_ROMCU
MVMHLSETDIFSTAMGEAGNDTILLDVVGAPDTNNNTTVIFESATERSDLGLYYVPENSHVVIPLISFVFGFPIFVIGVLCLVQHRNKRHYKKQQDLYLQMQRLSTCSAFERERNYSTASTTANGRLSFSQSVLVCYDRVSNGGTSGAGPTTLEVNPLNASTNKQRHSLQPPTSNPLTNSPSAISKCDLKIPEIRVDSSVVRKYPSASALLFKD